MTTPNPAAIRHIAGQIAAAVCFPHPDHHHDTTLTNLTHLLHNFDILTTIGGLATAGTLITHLTGTHPNIDTLAHHTEPTTTDPATQLGHDTAIGFTRHTLNQHPNIDHAITFFFDTLADHNLTDENLDTTLSAALTTIITIYALTPLTPP